MCVSLMKRRLVLHFTLWCNIVIINLKEESICNRRMRRR